MKILFVGHYGGKNIGDEIILLTQLQLFKNYFGPDTSFVIHTYDEIFTKEMYLQYGFKVETIQGFGFRNMMSSFKGQLEKIKDIDFVIIGGGGLIQDVYFAYGIFRYLLPAFIGYKRNIPVYTFSLGVYRFNYKLNKSLFRSLLKVANGVSVRDDVSFNNCKKILYSREIFKVPDSALLFDKTILEKIKATDNYYITIILREFFNPYLHSITAKVSELVKENEIKGVNINIIVFESAPFEKQIADRLQKDLKEDINIANVDILSDINPVNYLNYLNKSDLVISGRLHGIIPSVILKKNVICLSYSPKIESFCEERNYSYIKIEDLKSEIKFAEYINKFKSDKTEEQKYLSTINTYLSHINATLKNKPSESFNSIQRNWMLIKLLLSGIILLGNYAIAKVLKIKHTQE